MDSGSLLHLVRRDWESGRLLRSISTALSPLRTNFRIIRFRVQDGTAGRWQRSIVAGPPIQLAVLRRVPHLATAIGIHA